MRMNVYAFKGNIFKIQPSKPAYYSKKVGVSTCIIRNKDMLTSIAAVVLTLIYIPTLTGQNVTRRKIFELYL